MTESLVSKIEKQKNVFSEGKLDKNSTVKEFLTTAADWSKKRKMR